MDYRLDAGDKALVEAARVKAPDGKRTAQANRQDADASPIAPLSPRERVPAGG